MFPEIDGVTPIPADVSKLSASDRLTLAKTVRDEVKAKLAAGPSGDDLTNLRTALAAAMALKADALALATAEAEIATDEQAEADAVAEAERIAAEAAEVEEAEAVEPTVEDTDEVEEADEVTAAVPAKVRSTLGGAPATPVAPDGTAVFSPAMRAVDGVAGHSVGDSFGSWLDLAESLIEKARQVKPNTSERFGVARIEGQFDERHVMGPKVTDNLRMFEREEIMAALCAPLPPVYDLACMNSTRRPVKGSLTTYRAPRGGVSIYPSPTLEDITTGVGVWTAADDANAAAVKEACATIECATPVEYRWQGIYRCITIKNMLAMTFPELVEAYLNRLGAAFARLAEVQLLEAMYAETDEITAHTLGYNASVSLTSNILNYLALYREQQRWDDQEFDAWMPRWIVPALQADQIRRRNTNGQVLSVPTEGQIRQVFVDAGVTPHFFLDTPSWATPIPRLQVTGRLGEFTRNLEVLVAPRGKFAVMDEGNLNIGVTGNNIYRDNDSNAHNQFTMFWESFEGIVNTDSCPAHTLIFDNLCFNGQQIADVVINCEGGDEVGAAS